MGRYAIVVAGQVVNVIESDAEFASAIAGNIAGGQAIESDTASPGDAFAVGVFTPPTPGDPVLPDDVERWRAHYVLTAHGYMDAVLAAIGGIADAAQRNLARAEFTQRPYIHRVSYWTQMLQQAVGISDAERDAMFIEAAAL